MVSSSSGGGGWGGGGPDPEDFARKMQIQLDIERHVREDRLEEMNRPKAWRLVTDMNAEEQELRELVGIQKKQIVELKEQVDEERKEKEKLRDEIVAYVQENARIRKKYEEEVKVNAKQAKELLELKAVNEQLKSGVDAIGGMVEKVSALGL